VVTGGCLRQTFQSVRVSPDEWHVSNWFVETPDRQGARGVPGVVGGNNPTVRYPVRELEFRPAACAQRCSIVPEVNPGSGGSPARPDAPGAPAIIGDSRGAVPTPPLLTRVADRTYDEDRLDLLENAHRSASERRRTDFRFIALTLLLLGLLVALIAGAVLLWRHFSGG